MPDLAAYATHALPWIAIPLQIALCVLVADFFSGLLHWLEDSYGRPDWPITGRLVTQPNILHHHDPAAFTRNSWLRSADVLLVIGGVIVVAALLLGSLTWQVALVLLLGIKANEIHKWNHRPRTRIPRIARLLQELSLLQTPAHHALHHCGTKDTHYCVITNHLNPVLERLRFWRRLEAGIALVFRAEKRPDHSITRALRAA